MKKKFIWFCLIPFLLFADVIIDNVEYNFTYVPWYTGSLLSLDGKTVPKGVVEVQPYLFGIVNYGDYTNNFSLRSEDKEISVIPQFILYYGFTKSWDMELIIQTISKFKNGQSSTHFGDSSLLFGFQLLRETKNLPYIRFTINEIFPTGKHDKSNPSKNRTDLSGRGIFDTFLGLNAEKFYDWFPSHPIRFRINFSIGIPSKVTVKGNNSFGGAEDTNGKIRPGINYFLLLSPEYSITQRWVLTTDLIYSHTQKSSFSGFFGTINGEETVLNLGKKDSLQFAPAIEYNFSSYLGIILGSWFSIIGRNEDAFVSGVISFDGSF